MKGNEHPVVSIIVPVYNAMSTLERCVDSILTQEFRDFELILADDGSRDGSEMLCDAYAEKDNRVRVLHKANSGVSDTRNQAVGSAQGTYIQFVDSDDWITPESTKLLVRTAEAHQCDMVIADFYRVAGKNVSRKGDITEQRVLDRKEFASFMMKSPADFYYGVLWNKLFRRDIIERWRLQMDPRLRWCEDFIFNLDYILHADRFYSLTVPVYYYVRTKGSLVAKQLNPISVIRMKRMVFEYYNQFYKNVFDEQEYAKRRPQIYQFLVDAAGDGFALPSFLPGSRKLGTERSSVSENAIRGDGALLGAYRDQKLLEHYLEIAALKNDLSLAETKVLFLMQHEKKLHDANGREIAELMGMQQTALLLALQKLSLKGMILVKGLPEADAESEQGQRQSEKEAQAVSDAVSEGNREGNGIAKTISLPLFANVRMPLELELLTEFEGYAQLMQDLHDAATDYEDARFSGFTEEEYAQYEALMRKIKNNEEAVLLPAEKR